jgi:hypothetical protein
MSWSVCPLCRENLESILFIRQIMRPCNSFSGCRWDTHLSFRSPDPISGLPNKETSKPSWQFEGRYVHETTTMRCKWVLQLTFRVDRVHVEVHYWGLLAAIPSNWLPMAKYTEIWYCTSRSFGHCSPSTLTTSYHRGLPKVSNFGVGILTGQVLLGHQLWCYV